ncbi:MAG: hypothetical protein HW375_32 [Anaerolineales bacterium]|nr:hypothetical protein [Anaerolineales bacterium]
MATAKFDFGLGFDVTESPADEFNINLDLAEVLTYKDEGVALTASRTVQDFLGTYQQAIDDAAATATRIRGSYALYDAIVDSAQHESLDTGTATAGGASTLTDGAKAWAVNNWARCRVVITGGTGIGQVRVISSNTATELTVSATWTTNPDGTSTYLIQPSPPVYRRLAEAIAGGHASIFYRAASGEVDFQIASGDAVNYIGGDDVGGADIAVAITSQRVGLLFQNLRFTGNKALYLLGVGSTVIGCQFALNAYVRLAASAASLVACFFNGAGGAAQTPVSIESANNRVQACSFLNQSSATLIKAIAGATGITVTGILNAASAETGYLIDFPLIGNNATVNGCLLNVPNTAAGGVRIGGAFSNLTGNYISLAALAGAGTLEGASCSASSVISGNIIQSGAVSGTGKIVNLIHVAPGGGIAVDLIANNLLYCSSYNGTAAPIMRCLLIDVGGAGVIFSGNICYVGVSLFLANGQPIGVDPADAVAAKLVMTNNQFIGTTLLPPFPWKAITLVGKETILEGMSGIPPISMYRVGEAEDFRHGVIPLGWTGFGATVPLHNVSARGGVARLATGTTGTKDSGIRQDLDHVSFDDFQFAYVGAHLNIDVVTNCKVWVGLAPNAQWAASMTRPTDGIFLELDTDTGTVNDENGTTTSASSTVLTDTGKAWLGSQWIGAQLRYTSGPAAGQAKNITASTGTTLTTAAFSPAPTVAGGDTYVIESDADSLVDSGKTWTVNRWAGHQVVTTGGTGSGQTRTITSNTATVLILSSVWGTIPDNTTTYTLGGWALLVMDASTIRTAKALALATAGVHTFVASMGRNDALSVWFDGVLYDAAAGGNVALPATLVCPGAYVVQSSVAVQMDVGKIIWGCDQL